ncbi:MAG: hypothetical protein ACOX6T_08665 [Myxococcales bacterium]|jgi:hypothetical protein
MSSTNSVAAAVAEASQEQDVPDSSAWDQVASGQLALEFASRLNLSARRPAAGSKAGDRAGVKEAIIRWLEEQM